MITIGYDRIGNNEARQIATGEHPDEGSSSYRPSVAVAPEGMNRLSSNSLAGDKRHPVTWPTDLEADKEGVTLNNASD